MNTSTLRSASRVVMTLAAATFAACGAEKTEKPASDSAATNATTPKNLTLTADQKQRIQLVTIQPVSFRPVVEATGNVAFNGDRSTQVLSTVSGPATRVVVNPAQVLLRVGFSQGGLHTQCVTQSGCIA